MACYSDKEVNSIFRAGCKSPPAVKQSANAQALIRCNSGTDSTVWMKEDRFSYFCALSVCSGRILLFEVTDMKELLNQALENLSFVIVCIAVIAAIYPAFYITKFNASMAVKKRSSCSLV